MCSNLSISLCCCPHSCALHDQTNSLLSCTQSLMPLIYSFPLKLYTLYCACILTLPVQWSMLASYLSSLCRFFVVKAYVSLPCNIAVCTQVSYYSLFILKERPLITNKGKSSMNFALPSLNLVTILSEL